MSIYKMKNKIQRVGSRRQVFNGSARQTSGGLRKSDLKMNKWGRIVSARLSNLAKKQKHLEKAGYTAKKGKFGYVKTGKAAKKTRRKGQKSKTAKKKRRKGRKGKKRRTSRR